MLLRDVLVERVVDVGAGGELDFDSAGDVDGIIVELAVEGGKFVEKGEIK